LFYPIPILVRWMKKEGNKMKKKEWDEKEEMGSKGGTG
jgi:hypothetical protein